MERNSRTSLYEKLYNEIKQEIICGKLKEGAKLPSKRAQAERLGISVVTVENAYAQLHRRKGAQRLLCLRCGIPRAASRRNFRTS